MERSREAVLEWQSRWRVAAGAAAITAVVLMFASQLVNEASGDTDSEVLRSIHEHSGSVALSGILQGIAFALLAIPIYYLFRLARDRSDRVMRQLVGLVIVAPLFLALSSGLTIGARGEAADQFVAGDAKSTLTASEAKSDCLDDLDDEGKEDFASEYEPARGESALAACERQKVEDDEASNAVGEASLAPFVTGFGLAGGLGLAISLFYTCMSAMRVGLLSRFWGSLGMVAGVAFLLGPLFFISLIWFAYFGLLTLGALPRPPAWAAGEAVPWPTPGEKAAAELEPSNPADIDPSERRKRKQRDSDQQDPGEG
jgi:hypothetical protein